MTGIEQKWCFQIKAGKKLWIEILEIQREHEEVNEFLKQCQLHQVEGSWNETS